MASRSSVRVTAIIDQIDEFGVNDRCNNRSKTNTEGDPLNPEWLSEELRDVFTSSLTYYEAEEFHH